jgi:O-acetyl-ADP-ribose deacetylase (regulator of RNase III)
MEATWLIQEVDMAYVESKGNLFNSDAQTLVNTVNCVGVMGKGVALDFRLRFPEMFAAYQKSCANRHLRPGQILPYRKGHPWILNFAVKNDWKHPSRIEWVEACLKRFVGNYKQLGITSVAFPWLGAMNGGLPWNQVQSLMRSYLEPIADISIEVVEFDPDLPDPLYMRIRQSVQAADEFQFARQVGISPRVATLVYQAVREQNVPSMARLCAIPGLGKTSIERLYQHFRTQELQINELEPTLFDGFPA